jgi:endonuclease G, mitochondrial
MLEAGADKCLPSTPTEPRSARGGMKKIPSLLPVALATLIGTAAFLVHSNLPAPESIHLQWGNPSNAKPDPQKRANFLLLKPQYALSYNADAGTPNWVSWRLTKDDIGTAERAAFHPEPCLPPTFYKVRPADYGATGFDRGHMCPHADRSDTEENSLATFSMANMVPQAPSLNRDGWKALEDHCRKLALSGKTLWIVAGPHGKGGLGTAGEKKFLADGQVMVPASCWKVVLVTEGDTFERVIAAIMPNSEEVNHDWTRYAAQAEKVERLTGYSFFDRAPVDVLGPMKRKVEKE